MAAVYRERGWAAPGLSLIEEGFDVAVAPPSLDIELVEVTENALGTIRSLCDGLSKVFAERLPKMLCDLLGTGDCAGRQHVQGHQIPVLGLL